MNNNCKETSGLEQLLAFLVEFDWDTAVPICLHIVYGSLLCYEGRVE